jgi:rhamnosyl/mannosyltransferase
LKPPIRVLHAFKVCPLEHEGGIERAIMTLAAAMEGSGYRHEYFCLADDGPWSKALADRAITLHTARRSGRLLATDFAWSAPGQFAALARHMDIIHYHLPWPFVHALDRAVPKRIPRVATYHADICRNPLIARVYTPFMRRFLQSMDAVITTSDAYRHTSPVLAQVDPAKLHTVALAPDAAGLSQAVVARHREALAQAHGHGFMLFLGNTRRYKGADVAIEALRYTDGQLIIAGDSPNAAALRAQAQAAGVTDRLTLLGRVSDEQKWALLELCRLMVMPSILRSEAFGIALVEAAMASRPAITCEIGTGTTHVVKHQKTGLVVPPRDPVALGQAMAGLMADPAWAAALGEAGRRRYLALFTPARYAAGIRGVYDQAIGRQSPSTSS